MEFIGALLQLDLVAPETIRRWIGQFPVQRDRVYLRARLRAVLNDLKQLGSG